MTDGLPTADLFAFDKAKLQQFTYQVAAARVLAATTTARWKDYKASRTLNFFYGLKSAITLGHAAGPGFMEVDAAASSEVRQKIAKYYPSLWSEFRSAVRQGPPTMKSWLDRQQRLYDSDIHYLKRVFQEARQINQQVDEALRVIIFRLAEIKFVSEVMLNVLGLIPGGGALGLTVRTVIGVGYPIFVNVVENWNRVGAAHMVLSTTTSTVAQNLPSLLGEDAAVSKAQLALVDKPSLDIARQKALKKMTGVFAGKKAKEALLVKQANIEMTKLGIKVTAVGLQGLACWFCYKSCQDSAKSFWATIGE